MLSAVGISAYSQSETAVKPADDKAKKVETKEQAAAEKKAAKADPKAPVTAEGVAESTIIIYGGLGGRKTLDQIRKTTIERGKVVSEEHAEFIREPDGRIASRVPLEDGHAVARFTASLDSPKFCTARDEPSTRDPSGITIVPSWA